MKVLKPQSTEKNVETYLVDVYYDLAKTGTRFERYQVRYSEVYVKAEPRLLPDSAPAKRFKEVMITCQRAQASNDFRPAYWRYVNGKPAGCFPLPNHGPDKGLEAKLAELPKHVLRAMGK